MEQRFVGDSGLRVSVLGLGTMTFGAETDEAEAHRQLDVFVERGGTLIDTADVYAGGASEEILGRWLKGGRDDVAVATKGRFGIDAVAAGASRRALQRALDASRRRLGIDVVDLYFVHCWDAETPIEETLETLSGFVADGRIRYAGFSNLTGWQLQKVVTTARLGGYTVPVAFQPQYNLLDRGIEWDLLPLCLEEGIGVTPWSPLGGGWLTGKYRRDAVPEGATRLGEDPGRGVEAYDLRNVDATWRVLDVVEEIAADHDASWASVAIAWLLSRPGVSSVLLGARTTAQLADNLTAVDLTLDDDRLDRLTDVSAPGLPAYPHGFVEGLGGLDVWKLLGTARTEGRAV